MAKFYFKSDGNGGMIISKSTMALISLIILFLSTFTTIVAYSVGVKAQVQNNKQNILNNHQKIQYNTETLNTCSQNTAVIRTDVQNMKEEMHEMRADIKELIKSGGTK